MCQGTLDAVQYTDQRRDNALHTKIYAHSSCFCCVSNGSLPVYTLLVIVSTRFLQKWTNKQEAPNAAKINSCKARNSRGMIDMKQNGIFCPLTHHSPYDSNVLRGTNRHIYAWKRGVLVFDINNAILGRPIIYVSLSVKQACKIKQPYKSPFPDVRPSITICNEDVIWMSTIWYMVGIKFIPEITHLTTWDA